jgi:hypothetical protein
MIAAAGKRLSHAARSGILQQADARRTGTFHYHALHCDRFNSCVVAKPETDAMKAL